MLFPENPRCLRVLTCAALSVVLLASCGGGGGGGNGAGNGGGSQNLPPPEALTFLEPDSFSGGSEYETVLGLVDFRGGFLSTFVTGLDCSDTANHTPRAYLKVQWQNLASGESGTATSAIGCVDNGLGGLGTQARWWTEFISLELGANVFQFEVVEGSEVTGRNRVTVYRKDGKAPSVSFVSPAPDSVDTPVDVPIFVLFSEPVDESTLTTSRLTVRTAAGTDVAGLHSYDPGSHTWKFEPSSPMTAGVTYVAMVGQGVEDNYRGVLEEDMEWQFTAGNAADTTPPDVVRTWPAGTCPCSPPDTRILLEANEAIDPGLSMAVVDSQNNSIAGELVYHGRVLEFVPANPLSLNETYTVTADPLRDLLGNESPESASWQFATNDGVVHGSWQELAPIPWALRGIVMASDNTSVFVFGNDIVASGFQGYAYQPASDQWQQVAELLPFGATTPEPRQSPGVIWSGFELLVYGGFIDESDPQDDGGAYLPVNDTWRTLSGDWWDGSRGSFPQLQGLGGHSALWTGSKMLLWGGAYGYNNAAPTNRGWTYNPASDAWDITGPEPTVDDNYDLIPDDSAPSPRSQHSAIWTGTEMLVWGGVDAAGNPLADGGRYDPAADSWQPLSSLDAPGIAPLTATVWTGAEMLAWNGGQVSMPEIAGETMPQIHLRAYDPLTDTWRIPESGWEPAFLRDTRFFMFESGTGVIAVGLEAGENDTPYFRTLSAYAYDFATGRWTTGEKLSVPVCHLDAATLHMGDAYVSCSGQTYRFTP